MASLRHVQRGQPLKIPADDWNRIVDATRAFYEQQAGGGTRPANAGTRQASVILVRNDSGSDRQRFDVLGVGRPVITPEDNPDEFKRQVALTGVVPMLADHASGRFVVLQEPVAAGGIARAVVSGVSVARVNVKTGQERFADVADGEPGHLYGNDSTGAAVLWLDTASVPGVVLAVVQLGVVSNGFWAELGSATSIGVNRWQYPFTEAQYRQQGQWEQRVGGRSGVAFNTLEAPNSDSGVQGNGVDVANLPEGVNLVPIGAGSVVWMRRVVNCQTASDEYVFAAVNQVDGACS